MSDNVTLDTLTGSPVAAADEIGGAYYQRVKLSQGADGSATDVSSAAPLNVTLANTGANATAVKVDGSASTQPVSGTVTAAQATAASLNATVVGTGTFAVQAAQSGSWTVALGAGSATIGKLDANSGVDIGDVDVTSVPADPFGVNADAASATGSISAKLRFIASTGIPITGTVTVGSHAVTNAGTFATQVDGAALTALQLIDDPVATLGTTTYTEATTKGMIVGAVRRDADTPLADTTNEISPLITDANGYLKVEVFDGGGTHTVDAPVGAPVFVRLSDGSAAISALSVRSRFIQATFGTITRPANTTPYGINDAVSNNATAGSVTSQTATVSDVNDDPVTLERLRLDSTDTGFAGKAMRAWFWSTDPTASTGIVGGDNAAFSTKKTTQGFLGTMSGVLRTFSDGSSGILTPDEGQRIITKPVSGAMTVYYLLQVLEAATPSANSTTFIGTLEGFQGRA